MSKKVNNGARMRTLYDRKRANKLASRYLSRFKVFSSRISSCMKAVHVTFYDLSSTTDCRHPKHRTYKVLIKMGKINTMEVVIQTKITLMRHQRVYIHIADII